MVEKLNNPADVHLGDTVNLNVVVRASQPIPGTLRIFQKASNRTTPLVEKEVQLNRGVNAFTVPIRIDETNFYTYEARFQPADFDLALHRLKVVVGGDQFQPRQHRERRCAAIGKRALVFRAKDGHLPRHFPGHVCGNNAKRPEPRDRFICVGAQSSDAIPYFPQVDRGDQQV